MKTIEEILKILLIILKVFKKNLEVLENFNKMYTIMYAFHCFFQVKHYILIVYIAEFFLKSGGGQMHYWLPPSKIWGEGEPWPSGPLCGGPNE